MKIKHWAGYGTIEAKVVDKRENGNWRYVMIYTRGDHERGIVRDDAYDIEHWLLKKHFAKDCDKVLYFKTLSWGSGWFDGKFLETAVYELEYTVKEA